MAVLNINCYKCGNIFEAIPGRKYCEDCKFKTELLRHYILLEIERRQGKKQSHIWVKCRCTCNNEKWIMWSNIRIGKTMSCGCANAGSIKNAIMVHQKKANDRKEKIIKLAAKHPTYTLQEIGNEVGVSREYVRKVINAYTGFRQRARTAQRNLEEENARLRAIIIANGLDIPEI